MCFMLSWGGGLGGAVRGSGPRSGLGLAHQAAAQQHLAPDAALVAVGGAAPGAQLVQRAIATLAQAAVGRHAAHRDAGRRQIVFGRHGGFGLGGQQLECAAHGAGACTTSATGAPPVSDSRSCGRRRNTPLGCPAAAQTSSKRNSSRSIRVTGGLRWPTGDTPPMAKPVLARTKSASARPVLPTRASTFFSSTRRSPEAITSTARLSLLRLKMMLLAIWPTATPRVSAASWAVRQDSPSICGAWGWPLACSAAATRCTPSGRGFNSAPHMVLASSGFITASIVPLSRCPGRRRAQAERLL